MRPGKTPLTLPFCETRLFLEFVAVEAWHVFLYSLLSTEVAGGSGVVSWLPCADPVS